MPQRMNTTNATNAIVSPHRTQPMIVAVFIGLLLLALAGCAGADRFEPPQPEWPCPCDYRDPYITRSSTAPTSASATHTATAAARLAHQVTRFGYKPRKSRSACSTLLAPSVIRRPSEILTTINLKPSNSTA